MLFHEGAIKVTGRVACATQSMDMGMELVSWLIMPSWSWSMVCDVGHLITEHCLPLPSQQTTKPPCLFVGGIVAHQLCLPHHWLPSCPGTKVLMNIPSATSLTVSSEHWITILAPHAAMTFYAVWPCSVWCWDVLSGGIT